MTRVSRVFITRHPYGEHLNYEVLASKWYLQKDTSKALRTVKASERLVDILKRKDENKFHFEFIGVKIEKFNKGSAFNKHNENIYVNYSFGKRDSTFRLRAVRRLARYLERKDPSCCYSGSYILKRVGENCYSICNSMLEYRTIKDKDLIIRRKQSAAKASLTKVIKKLKAIREEYRNSLFTEDYKSDKKYINEFKKIYEKREKIRLSERLMISDISTFNTEVSKEDELKIIELLRADELKKEENKFNEGVKDAS